MSREQNRAAMPLAAEMIDEVRATYPDAKVLWVKEGEREMGKRPKLEPELFEISAETYDALRLHSAYLDKRGRK